MWALRRVGYDPRGYGLQCLIAVCGVVAGRLLPRALNVNGAFADPILKKEWGGALAQVVVVAGALVLVVYPVTHLALSRLLPRAPRAAARS